MEVVASLSQGRTAAAQCGLFTHKSVPVIFEPPCISRRTRQTSIATGVQNNYRYMIHFAKLVDLFVIYED